MGRVNLQRIYFTNSPNFLFFSLLLSPTREKLGGTPEPEYLLKAELISGTSQSRENRHRLG